MTLDSEGISSDGDAFEWLDENIPDQFQINTNSEGYTLSMQMKSARLNGVLEHRAELDIPNKHGTTQHRRVRGVKPRIYGGKMRGETLREALGKHFEELEPDAYDRSDREKMGDRTDKMGAEEFLRKFDPPEEYVRIFLIE